MYTFAQPMWVVLSTCTVTTTRLIVNPVTFTKNVRLQDRRKIQSGPETCEQGCHVGLPSLE